MVEMDEKRSRMWAMFCHFGAFAGFIIPYVGNIIGPLVIWQIKKDESPLVDDQGKESLNFQISMTIYAIVAFLLCFVIIGIPILIALAIFWFIIVIIAGVKANNGEKFRYPLCIRLIK